MSRRTRTKTSASSVSIDSVQSPYSIALNADDSEIESLLAEHDDFIRGNSGRIPEFGSAAAARAELAKLDSRIQDLKSKASSDASSRLSAISLQRDSMLSEDEGIERLRSIARDAAEREEREYSQIQADIEHLQANLTSLQKQNAARKKAAQTARDMREMAKSDFQNRSSELQQLNREYQRLHQLEKQSKEQLRSVKIRVQRAQSEETAVNEMEGDIEIQQGNLRNLRAEISKRKQVLADKKNSIQEWLGKAEDFEDQIDLACEGKPVHFADADQGSDNSDDQTVRDLLERSNQMLGSDDDSIQSDNR
jgi:chromosome segregation ATPase